MHAGRNWVEFSATVEELEELLKTEYHTYKHKESGGYRIACEEYGIPQHVREHVDFIMPTIQLDGLRPVSQSQVAVLTTATNSSLTDLSQCGSLVTINCLRALYNFPVGKYNHTGNQLGIAEWADYLYLPDLKGFFARFTAPKIPLDVVPEFISIDGGKRANLTVAKAEEVVESALDVQTAYSMIWPQQIRLYQVGDSVNVDSVGTFNIFLDALVGPKLRLPHQSLTSSRTALTARTKAETSPT
jgi:tripeptidyl-peptidase-1